MILEDTDYANIRENIEWHGLNVTSPITTSGYTGIYGPLTINGPITVGSTTYSAEELEYLLNKLKIICKDQYPEDFI